MVLKLRQTTRFWLRLLLMLQVAGLFGHAMPGHASKPAAESTPVAALSQVLGYDVAICHHGDHAPVPGAPDDCCSGGFCQCCSHATFDAPSGKALLVPPVAERLTASRVPPVGVPGRPVRVGAEGARGPPLPV